jgi:regulatory protein
MAGRRGARAGRGWDAIPPRPTDKQTLGGVLRDDDTERGNVAGRRRRSLSGSSSAFGAGGFSGGASGGSDGDPFADRGGSAGGGGFSDRGGSAGGGFSDRGGSTGGGFADRGGSAGVGFGDRGGSTSGAGLGEGRRGAAQESAAAELPRSESEVAREICLRQLAMRPRTRAELAKALARRRISDDVITEVLDRYDEVGLVDDAALARAWVSSRHHGRGLAKRALANELRQRGIDAEVANDALETLDEDAEATTARALVDRKLRMAKGPPEAVFRRLVGMLARKGYPAGVAIRVVKDTLAARDAEAAEFADQIDVDALVDGPTEAPS